MATAYFPEVAASVVMLTIAGVERRVLLDGTFDLQMVSNGIDTLNCSIASFDASYRPGIRDDVQFWRDGVRVFGGIITSAPEAALASPALPDIVTQISASGYKIFATYRYVTMTIGPGPMIAALAALVPLLASHGVTLDPLQATGPDLPELVLIDSRFDAVCDQIVVLTEYAYTWTITPDKTLLFSPVGAKRAPWDLLDTGTPRQIGDVRIDRSLDDSYLNRATVEVQGAGPATSAETFRLADGVSAGGYTRFRVKYPASASINDLWPNELYINGIPQGPIAWGIADLVSVGGSFAWGWNYSARPAELVFDEAALAAAVAARVRAAGKAWRALRAADDRIDLAYAIAFPFSVTADNLADQAAYGIYEGRIAGPSAATIETAQVFAENSVAARSAVVGRALYTSPFGGLVPGLVQTVMLGKRGIAAECLIAEVRIGCWPDAEPGALLSSVTAVVGSAVGGLWRDVYKRWGGSGGGGGGGSVATTGGAGSGVMPGGRGSYALAASRIEWVQVPAAGAWTEASGLQVVLDTTVRGNVSAVVRLRVRARTPGVAVTARLFNQTDAVVAGVSDPVASTAFVSIVFVAELAAGSKAYGLELSASVANEDVQAIGYLE